jgi:curli production assembly/transport component CsgG
MFFAGGGYGFNSVVENLHAKIQYGAGLEFIPKCSIKLYDKQLNFKFIILIISKEARDDYYYRFGLV